MVKPPSKLIMSNTFYNSAKDQDFGFLDPDPQKYADPRIGIQGVKYQPKTGKKLFES